MQHFVFSSLEDTRPHTQDDDAFPTVCQLQGRPSKVPHKDAKGAIQVLHPCLYPDTVMQWPCTDVCMSLLPVVMVSLHVKLCGPLDETLVTCWAGFNALMLFPLQHMAAAWSQTLSDPCKYTW